MKSRYYTFGLNLTKKQFEKLFKEIGNFKIAFEVVKEYLRGYNYDFKKWPKGDGIIDPLVEQIHKMNKDVTPDLIHEWLYGSLEAIGMSVCDKTDTERFLECIRSITDMSAYGLCHNIAYIINSAIRTKRSIRAIIDNKFAATQNSVYFRLKDPARIINGHIKIPLLGNVEVTDEFSKTHLDPLWLVQSGYLKISFNEPKIAFIPMNGIDRALQSKCKVIVTPNRELYIKAKRNDGKEIKELFKLEDFGVNIKDLVKAETDFLKKYMKAKKDKKRVMLLMELEEEYWEPIYQKWLDKILSHNPISIRIPKYSVFMDFEDASSELNDILFSTRFYFYLALSGQKSFTIQYLKDED